ncbi:MAG: hypothetical protein QF561_05995 [Phycisphaerales bacterium]|jgi:hypothetical protein|nr:hypothetical protein [Phycisphaerales bacterium]
MQATRRWTIFIVAFVLTVLAYRSAWPWLRAATGDLGPTIVQSMTPAVGLVAMLAATAVSVVIAVTVARLVSPLSAMAILGAGLGWAGLDLAGMRDIVLAGSAGSVVADGIGWSIAVLAASWLILVLGSPVEDVHPEVVGRPPDPLWSVEALRMLVAGLAALPVVWLFAASHMRGQMLVATAVGAMAAAMVGRLWSPHVQPILLPVGVVLVGALGTWVLAMFLPADAARAWATGEVPHLMLPTPVDWAAGGLLGVPAGFRLVSSFIKHEGESVAA